MHGVFRFKSACIKRRIGLPPGVVDPRVTNMPTFQLGPERESVLGTMPTLIFTGNLRVRDQFKGLGGSHGVRIGRSYQDAKTTNNYVANRSDHNGALSFL